MNDPGFDVRVPNAARIYDYFIGGKDNYAADRQAAEELRRWLPDVERACRDNREFLQRAVRYLAGEAGVRQFIDVGSGLPTMASTHDIARAAGPGSRVVYADYDPVVVTHSRALLETSPDVAVIQADLRRPGVLLGSEAVTNLIDFTRPVAVLLVAVLHFITDDEDPHGIADALKSVMAPGSCLVISHATHDQVPREAELAGIAVYEKASAPIVPRGHGEVLKFFGGLCLVPPGLVDIRTWRSRRVATRPLIYGGVAVKT